LKPADKKMMFPAAKGEMAARVRDFDWTQTSLGPIAEWSPTLRIVVDMMLSSHFPKCLCWGPDLISLYNDAYRPILGAKPEALGRPFGEVWSEAWDEIAPIVGRALAGEATFIEDYELAINRFGRPEQAYFTFCYSPVRDENGIVVGMLDTVVETTGKVRADQQLLKERNRFLQLFEQAPSFMAVLRGPDHRFDYVNPACQRLIGKRKAVIGRPIAEVLPDAVEQGYLALLDNVYASQMPYTAFGARYDVQPEPDGSARVCYVDFVYQPIRDAVGTVTGIFVEGVDVTDRYEAHRLLKWTNERQSMLVRLLQGKRERDDPEAMMQQASQELGRLLNADRVGFFEMVGDHLMTFGASWNNGILPCLTGQWAAENTGTAYLAKLREGKTQGFTDVEKDPLTQDAHFLDIGIRSGIGAPIIRGGRLMAGVYVNQASVRAWTPAEVDLVRDVAELTWNAVERARSTELLRESETRFREVADAAPVLIWLSDTDKNCIWFNKSWLDFTGCTMKDQCGYGWVRRIHPDDAGHVLSTYESAFDRREQFRMTYRLRNRDDEWRIVADVGVPRFAGDGAFLGYIGSCIDVTEQQTAITALRRGEEQLRLATEAAEVGFWDVDVLTGALTWPPRVKAMFGISPEVPVTMADFYAGLHPEDREPTSAAYAAAVDPERRALYDVEYRTIGREDGITRWVAAKGRGIFDQNNRCIRVIGTVIDITRRKAIEERLWQLNEDLERQVEIRTVERDRVWRNSRDLIVILDRYGYIRSVNPAWQEILGHEPQMVIGEKLDAFVWPEDNAHALNAVTKGLPTDFDNRYRHRNGSPIWLEWRSSIEGDLVYAYGRDITADKLREDALRQTENALRQSQKMEAVGQLTGGIAHDFNNMLAVIIGSLNLLDRRTGMSDPRTKHYIDGALDAAKRAANLTQRLLAFSRQQPLHPVPIDVNDLVNGMTEILKHSLGSDIRLDARLGADLWRANADPNQLENVILNLGVNARDAMPQGGLLTIATKNITIDVFYCDEQDIPEGDYVMLCVCDSGTGMAPDIVTRAFDPFFTTKEVGKGTGLGLSQVYGFVKQSGGHIKIKSALGVGTEVRIYLPRFLGASADVEQKAPAELPGVHADETILVVDDEPVVRRLSIDALVELGYNVLEAEDATSVLTLLDLHPEITLLFTDIVMPNIHGRELADEARRRHPDLKILFTTGYARDAILDDGILDQGVELIGKPFTLEELAAKIRSVLDR